MAREPAGEVRPSSERRSLGPAYAPPTSALLGFLTGERVTLVTGDVSLRLRAAVRGLTVVAMPDTFRALLVDQSGPDARHCSSLPLDGSTSC
jgi:hypothetical protein